MKLTLCAALCLLLLGCSTSAFAAETDAGHFIPKAFYTLDAEGHKSDVHPVSPHTAHYLRRMRRDGIAVSSSSSSVAAEGGPVYFTQQSSLLHSAPPSAANRYRGTRGHVLHTVGVVDRNGRVRYKTTKGHL